MNDDFPCCKHGREHARPVPAEPTEAEVEAAARALWDLDPEAGYTFETDPSGQFLLRDARAALQAAAEARR